MKTSAVIVSVFLLLCLSACAQRHPDVNVRLCIENLSPTNVSGIISNTQPDVEYEMQCQQDQSNWISMGFVFGSETTNWTRFDFLHTNNINGAPILRVRSWIDSQGIGIPDWWQLKYFGEIGIDPFADPDGDGYDNLEEYLNGTDPKIFTSPPKAVSNLEALYTVNGGKANVTVSWFSPSPSVRNYTVLRYLNGVTNFYTVLGGNNSCTWVDVDSPPRGVSVQYRVIANYLTGIVPSTTTTDPNFDPHLVIP